MQCRINLRPMCACVVSTCLILWTLSARAAPVSQYTITDLGATAIPMAIAPTTLMVVGVQDVDTAPHQHQVASILTPYEQPLAPLPQGRFSTAQGVYGATVVGAATTGNLDLWTHATRWTAASDIVDLGTLGSANLFSAARGINSVGTLVGSADSPDQTAIVPVVWTESTLSRLPTLAGATPLRWRSMRRATSSGMRVPQRDKRIASFGLSLGALPTAIPRTAPSRWRWVLTMLAR